ncbi:MAG: bile acid:sodium symporter family protein [Saprospiraceae bacterium]|jgi:bile acid:Na+ symporter, BASS family|nr:bile acid:sodium symporter family protein [Saprospiraceae bacterium]MDP4998744.1 bile acid:sodium symporter family protein [Saprospiraceae bacterium]
METIDQIRINFDPDKLFVLNLCLAFLMFGVALDMQLHNFRKLGSRPRALLVGLSSQLLLLPLLTLVLIYLFKPVPSLALGMILVAACPGGNVSNYAVHLARANIELSVVLTSISSMSSLLVTPLYFFILSGFLPTGETAGDININVHPGDMLLTLIQLIFIPVALGLLIQNRFPVLAARLKKPVQNLSMVVFLALILAALASNYQQIKDYLHLVFILVIVHNLVALSGGYAWSRLLRLPVADARTIALETGIQNSGLGLVIIFSFFDGLGGMALIAAWWGIWHLISAFALALFWRSRGA